MITQLDDKIKRFICDMPKAELHVHIEGTLEAEHLFVLAKRNNVKLDYSSPEECRAAYDFNDLPSFLKIYYEGMKVLQTEEDFYELTYQYFERASANNIIYVELFFDPQAHTIRGVEFSTVIDGISRAQHDAKNKLHIESNLIMCFLRDMSAESALEHLEMAKPYKNKIIGIGLDSDEYNNPPIKFKEVFAAARDHGWKLTMHCDVNQKNSIAHIRQCLHDINVHRIDHGVNSLEDPAVCDAIIQHQIGLTICPISNKFIVQTTCADKVNSMLEKGMLVTINSDDPAYFGGYLNDNFIALQTEHKFTKSQMLQLVKNAFTIAWITDNEKQRYLDRLKNYYEADVGVSHT